jgi:hypothetical protein
MFQYNVYFRILFTIFTLQFSKAILLIDFRAINILLHYDYVVIIPGLFSVGESKIYMVLLCHCLQ